MPFEVRLSITMEWSKFLLTGLTVLGHSPYARAYSISSAHVILKVCFPIQGYRLGAAPQTRSSCPVRAKYAEIR